MPFDKPMELSANQQIRVAAIEAAMYFHAGEGSDEESDVKPSDVIATASMFEAYIKAGS